ncbi:UDP-N-acetylmuramoyl-L-alanine--D-glutamate ligase [Alteromonas sp. MB-3u-76]|uniref:UDP-N-acetylmuramoyl-L-alanine--D-glutamate ligase n=1 Tax=unclassified Alteromonas TaxID=2614992 RepID=UPI000903689B|nr:MULTISPECIES: UDP-N-acetylmuramoyl-L-alanine--D-glutamate ligase [unclassified Alteromonas]APE06743.1 UDP-N-acetylmuramoylalanine--D-glutamate ligase [Alteromonas sp. RW2A1]AUC89269.1 UDP-N-acetylmuramoyl-L-alanine--D-glutamate ligase [Alteromonas sp. MB-3u-76]
MTYNVREHSYAVGGLGMTGQACVRYLLSHGAKVKAFDTRSSAALSDENLTKDMIASMQGKVETSPLTSAFYDDVDTLVLSPGLSPEIEQVALAKSCGVEVIGDIELFARLNTKPVVGITGSNGKTTVTLLATHLLNSTGLKALAAGNVGLPALDTLDTDADVVVLELSSFQLETTSNLALNAATILNLSDDHLDRHGSFERYASAKHRIFDNASLAIVWRDGDNIQPRSASLQLMHYGLGESEYGFGIAQIDDKAQLTFNGNALIDVSEIQLAGTHNVLNVMASLGLCHALGVSPEAAVPHIKNFTSAPHRCVELANNGVRFIDDSKATNVGATIAALEGLAPVTTGKLLLIAGGDAKGADINALSPYLLQHVAQVFAIGKDAELFAKAFENTVLSNDLSDAVKRAYSAASHGDVVLLSPACASIDMFDNYMHRGQVFKNAVEEVIAA